MGTKKKEFYIIQTRTENCVPVLERKQKNNCFRRNKEFRPFRRSIAKTRQ